MVLAEGASSWRGGPPAGDVHRPPCAGQTSSCGPSVLSGRLPGQTLGTQLGTRTRRRRRGRLLISAARTSRSRTLHPPTLLLRPFLEPVLSHSAPLTGYPKCGVQKPAELSSGTSFSPLALGGPRRTSLSSWRAWNSFRATCNSLTVTPPRATLLTQGNSLRRSRATALWTSRPSWSSCLLRIQSMSSCAAEGTSTSTTSAPLHCRDANRAGFLPKHLLSRRPTLDFDFA